MDLFGIFDGHGGKQAASFAAKHLAGNLTKNLSQQQSPHLAAEDDSGSACSADTTFDASGQADDGQESESSEASSDGIQQLLQDCPAVKDQGIAAWRAQDSMAAALPEAMMAAFEQTQSDFFGHQKVSSCHRSCLVAQAVGAHCALKLVNHASRACRCRCHCWAACSKAVQQSGLRCCAAKLCT